MTEPLDIDANNATNARTDGLLVMRYLFGLRGAALVQGAVGPNPGRTNQQIEDYLAASSSAATPVLDIDDNGARDALTDGLLVFRYLLGMRGAPLIAGAVGVGAQRDTFTEIENYLATLTTVTPEPLAGCTVVASPPATMAAPVTPGTSVQLTASCAAGQQPITFTWDGGAFTGSVRTVAPMTTTTYSMVASNGVGAAPAVNVTVHVAPASYCQPGDHVVDVPWPSSGQTRPGTNGFTNQVYSFRLTVPFTFNPPLNITHLGFVHVAEIPGAPVTYREITVSRSACDFHAPPGGYLFDNLGVNDNGPGFNFTANNPNGWQAVGAQINFQSGDVIYVSVRNFSYNNGSPTPTCPVGQDCGVLVDFAMPNRY